MASTSKCKPYQKHFTSCSFILTIMSDTETLASMSDTNGASDEERPSVGGKVPRVHFDPKSTCCDKSSADSGLSVCSHILNGVFWLILTVTGYD